MALAPTHGVRPDHMLPNRLLVATYVGRHFRLWALLRIGFSGVFLWARIDPLRITSLTTCAVVVLCAAVSAIELHVRHERVLLGNLGIDSLVLSVMLVAPPLAGELVVRGLVALLG